MTFLLNTPAVMGFGRAKAHGGIDPDDGSSLEVTRNRVAVLFSALLGARPTYFQARFLDTTGAELIRVDRAPNGLVSRTPQWSLQPTNDRADFVETAKLPRGAVYISDIALDREQGTIAEPYRPTALVATPVYDPSGVLLGVVVLNVDMKSLFDLIAQTVGAGMQTFVANDSGDYLADPDPAKTFGFDLGRRFRVQDDFPALAPLLSDGHATYAGVVGQGASRELIVAGSVAFDPRVPQRHLVIAALGAGAVPAGELLSTGTPIAIVALVVLLMGALTAAVLVRVLVLPLRRMTERRSASPAATAASTSRR